VGGADLKVGAIVGPQGVTRWARRCLERLLDLPGARLCLVIRPAAVSAAQAAGAAGVAWGLAERRARRRSAALQPASSDILTGVPVVPCAGPAAATAAVAGAGLDVVVDLYGADELLPVLGGAARHGAWALAFGPEGTGAAGPVGAADLQERRPTATVSLVSHRGDGQATVLRHGTLRTIAHSWRRHRDQLLLHAADWPASACRDLLAGRDPAVGRGYAGAERSPAPPGSAGSASPGPPLHVGRLAWRVAANRVGRALRALRDDQWHVGIVDAPIEAFLRPDALPAPSWLPEPPHHTYYADPFPCPDGRLVVERFEQRRRIGSLCALGLARHPGTARGAATHRSLATPPHHISYPYVVEEAGQVYVTPETAELGEVGLYRLGDEPLRMEKVATLVEGVAAVDPTVLRHRGRWWMFFTDGRRDPDADLHVWHADRLAGPWRPHGRNPVRVDVCCGRPAGTPFTYRGALYRPAMDNSSTYGGRVVIAQVTELTPDAFAEHVAAVVPPFPGRFGAGIHTLARADGFTVVDGKRTIVVPTAWPAKLRAHLAGR
jgi:hypothetical protein